jgi:hypothetical protein
MENEKTHSLIVSKKDIYDNCTMLSPEGEFMCRCDAKRMQFYLRKNLAVMRPERGENTFMLTFTPNGFGHDPDSFMGEPKKNMCVVCGTEDDLTKHHVVPYCYRMHMPETYKSGNSFDVLPVCWFHHDQYNEFQFAMDCDLQKPYAKVVEEKNNIGRGVGLCKALFNFDKMPLERQTHIYDRLKEFFTEDELIVESPRYLYNTMMKNQSSIPPVAKMIVDAHDLKEFVLMWRQHFLDYASPEHLSDRWMSEYKHAYLNGL